MRTSPLGRLAPHDSPGRLALNEPPPSLSIIPPSEVSTDVRRTYYEGLPRKAASYYEEKWGKPTSFYEEGSVVTGVTMNSNYNTHYGRQESRILSERFNEHRIRVPKKIIREECFEKIVIVPERKIQEEVIEEEQVVREKIIEVAKPVIQETVVEIPEYEYRDKIVEVPEIRVQERLHHVPKVEVVERINHVPKIIRQEKIVEVPVVEYREVPVVRKVEVPQIQEEFVYRERPVPQYVDKPVAEVVEVPQPYTVPVKVPVPVAAEMVYRYEVPQVDPVVKKRTFPLYVPKFVEVPVPRPFVDQFIANQAMRFNNHHALMNRASPISLAELDQIAARARNNIIEDLPRHVNEQNLIHNWETRNLNIVRAGNSPHSFAAQRHGVPVTMRGRGLHRSQSKSRAKSLLERMGCPFDWSPPTAADLVDKRQRKNRVDFSKVYPTQHYGDYYDSEDASSYCSSCSECNGRRGTAYY